MINFDKEWDFLYWDDTDFDDEWVSDKPKSKESGKTIED